MGWNFKRNDLPEKNIFKLFAQCKVYLEKHFASVVGGNGSRKKGHTTVVLWNSSTTCCRVEYFLLIIWCYLSLSQNSNGKTSTSWKLALNEYSGNLLFITSLSPYTHKKHVQAKLCRYTPIWCMEKCVLETKYLTKIMTFEGNIYEDCAYGGPWYT